MHQACAETMRRVLRKYNFHGRTARNKPFVIKMNKIKRMEFAKAHLHKDFDYWKIVIYADESKYIILKSDSKI